MPRRTLKATRKRQALFKDVNESDHAPTGIWPILINGSTSWEFQLLVFCRLLAAIWSPISDCDEVYNYWEPLHFLLYGRGFQTWEYSPVYAIRSYAYILLHYFPARLFSIFTDGKTTFFLMRTLLTVISASSDTVFYSNARRRFGDYVGWILLAFQLSGAGYFLASAAFLPSSFAMVMTSFAYGYWMNSQHDGLAVMFIAISALVGWPFAALLGVPIAVDMLIPSTLPASKSPASRWKSFIFYSFISGSFIGGFMLICDSAFYGKLTLAPFNIIRYNIFTPHGPDLYGVAPLSYYLINLFLNWNIAAVLSCLTLPSAAVLWYFRRPNYAHWRSILLVQLGYWLWLLVFFRQPHKEERFLFPVYPLLCLSAALTLDFCRRLISSLSWIGRYRRLITKGPIIASLGIFMMLSGSRFYGQCIYFGAPTRVFGGIEHRISETGLSGGVQNVNLSGDAPNVNVCVGKEWHRFPSTFFLPKYAQLQFIKSEFAGLLPKPYPTVPAGDLIAALNVTRTIPTEMNDVNKEEVSRYVDVSACNYLIDLDTGEEPTALEPNYSGQIDTWTVVGTAPFLIGGKSHPFFRAFYVPYLSERYCTFGGYYLLERRS